MMDNILSLMPSTSSNSLSSVGSQDSVVEGTGAALSTGGRKSRQQVLEERHQDLLIKQKKLQAQYKLMVNLLKENLVPKFNLNKNLTETAANLTQTNDSIANLKNQSLFKNRDNITVDVNTQILSKDDLSLSSNNYNKNKVNLLLTNSLSSPNKTNQLNGNSNKNILSNNSSTDIQKLESSI